MLLVSGMLSLPLLPAAASGLEPQAPAGDLAAHAKPAKQLLEPAAGNDRKPADDFIPQAEPSQHKPAPDGQKVRVKASQPLQREVADWLNLPGRFDSVTTVSVRPRVSGTLVDAKCSAGLQRCAGRPFVPDRSQVLHGGTRQGRGRGPGRTRSIGGQESRAAD